jgi:hypothetical protein
MLLVDFRISDLVFGGILMGKMWFIGTVIFKRKIPKLVPTWERFLLLYCGRR